MILKGFYQPSSKAFWKLVQPVQEERDWELVTDVTAQGASERLAHFSKPSTQALSRMQVNRQRKANWNKCATKIILEPENPLKN